MAALRLVFENKSSILTPNQGTHPSVSNDPPIIFLDQILQQFKAKILNMDLVQSLRQDDGSYFQVKGLIESLNNSPETASNKELLRFLLGFCPLLDTLARDFQRKREITTDANKQDLLRQKELTQGEYMRAEAFSLDVQAQKEKSELEDLDVSIPLWEDDIQRLQAKVDAGKKRQAEISGSSLIAISAQQQSKAEAALQHFEKAAAIEASTATLIAAESLVDSRLQELIAAYEAMKQNIKF